MNFGGTEGPLPIASCSPNDIARSICQTSQKPLERMFLVLSRKTGKFVFQTEKFDGIALPMMLPCCIRRTSQSLLTIFLQIYCDDAKTRIIFSQHCYFSNWKIPIHYSCINTISMVLTQNKAPTNVTDSHEVNNDTVKPGQIEIFDRPKLIT